MVLKSALTVCKYSCAKAVGVFKNSKYADNVKARKRKNMPEKRNTFLRFDFGGLGGGGVTIGC